MQLDPIHGASPDEERVGRVGGPLIAVSAAFYDESQVVVASKIYGGNYMGGLPGRNGIDAGRGLPRVQPSRDLRATRLIANVEGVCQVLNRLTTTRVPRSPVAGTEQRGHLEKLAVDGCFQALPGFPGRPGGVRGAERGAWV